MKAVVTKTSDWHYIVVKEFSTAEEVFKFMNECGHSLVLKENYEKGHCISDIVKLDRVTAKVAKQISECDYVIEIYDTWRE